MKRAKKILIKAYVAKTMLFLAVLIALISVIFWNFYPELYKGIPNMVLGELFVLILLADKLLANRCWYSWWAYIILVSCNVLNIVYLLTDFMDGTYPMIYSLIVIPIAFILAILAFINKGKEPTNPLNKKSSTIQSRAEDIGGGVLIGDKPKKDTDN